MCVTGTKPDDEGDHEEKLEEMKDLHEEAALPLAALLAKYKQKSKRVLQTLYMYTFYMLSTLVHSPPPQWQTASQKKGQKWMLSLLVRAKGRRRCLMRMGRMVSKIGPVHFSIW